MGMRCTASKPPWSGQPPLSFTAIPLWYGTNSICAQYAHRRRTGSLAGKRPCKNHRHLWQFFIRLSIRERFSDPDHQQNGISCQYSEIGSFQPDANNFSKSDPADSGFYNHLSGDQPIPQSKKQLFKVWCHNFWFWPGHRFCMGNHTPARKAVPPQF